MRGDNPETFSLETFLAMIEDEEPETTSNDEDVSGPDLESLSEDESIEENTSPSKVHVIS